MKATPIPDCARSRFRYDPETGAIVWTANTVPSKIGTVPWIHNRGYLRDAKNWRIA